VAVLGLLAAIVGFVVTPQKPNGLLRSSATSLTAEGSYPIGTVNGHEPSGLGPPRSGAIAGYKESYVTDFSGRSMPRGWITYSGVPGGDPGAEFGMDHVVVSGGLLKLNAFQDPAFHDQWVTGGVGQFGHSQTYGAYFVRFRLTGAGPAAVALLWPTDNSWPPEIDFSETLGPTNATTATVHFDAVNNEDKRSLQLDMTRWHTWGVIWTPTSVTYVVDGHTWGSVDVHSEIPHVPMSLALQEQTWCTSGYACPTTPESMDVAWVAEYTPKRPA